MMINQGINELSSLLTILLDTEVRDFSQCKIQVQTSDNIHHYQDGIAGLQLVYQHYKYVQIDEIAYLVCEPHLNFS